MKIRLFLLYSFPLTLYFSYYPIIPLGSSSSTNYELSLPLIWLFLFSFFSLKDFFRFIYNIYLAAKTSKTPLSKKPSLVPLAFLLYLSLSLLWSPNPFRGFLTVGVAWCLYISSVVIFTTSFSKTSPLNKSLFLKIFLFSAVAVSCFCWLQSILDVFDAPRGLTLLCRGCTSRTFGFPHPSGFTIEPQFMGNLLLAPTFLSLYLFLTAPVKTSKSFKSALLSVFLLTTLFFIFSRGAIYSFAVGFALFLVLNLFKFKNPSSLKTVPLVLLSLLFALTSQGILAASHKTYKISFSCAFSTSLSHLSLDLINLPCKKSAHVSPELDKESESFKSSKSPESLPEKLESPAPSEAPVFSGYVAESTDVRLELNRLALETSAESPSSLLFGYGLGSAGTVLEEKGKTNSKKEIIQNEYLSLLLETGVVGLFLFLVVIFTIFFLIKTIPGLTPSVRFLFFSAILSFLLSLLFFSGLPNALHLYLFPVFLILILFSSSKDKPIIN